MNAADVLQTARSTDSSPFKTKSPTLKSSVYNRDFHTHENVDKKLMINPDIYNTNIPTAAVSFKTTMRVNSYLVFVV